MVETAARPTTAGAFNAAHPWDRAAWLAVFLAACGLVVGGFGLDILDRFRSHATPYPWIVHVHAAASAAWLGLFATQLLFVRRRRLDLHRRVGRWGLWLAAAYALLALATTWIVKRAQLGTPASNPPFMIVEITEMTVFCVLTGAGLWLRRDGAAHKRLMLLALIYLCIPGASRLWGYALGIPFGPGPGVFWLRMFSVADALILALGAYDLATRGRLHRAYAAGLVWIAVNEAICAWLIFDPAWAAWSASIIGA